MGIVTRQQSVGRSRVPHLSRAHHRQLPTRRRAELDHRTSRRSSTSMTSTVPTTLAERSRSVPRVHALMRPAARSASKRRAHRRARILDAKLRALALNRKPTVVRTSSDSSARSTGRRTVSRVCHGRHIALLEALALDRASVSRNHDVEPRAPHHPESDNRCRPYRCTTHASSAGHRVAHSPVTMS